MDSAKDVLPETEKCWPLPTLFSLPWFDPLWVLQFFIGVAMSLQNLLVINVAVASLNGGIDPCRKEGSKSEVCANILQQITKIQAITTIGAGITGVFFSLAASWASDCIGRKPILLVTTCSNLVMSLVLTGVGINLISIYVLFVISAFNVMAPIIGMTCNLIVGDIVPDAQLAHGIFLLFGSFLLGAASATSFAAVIQSNIVCCMTAVIAGVLAVACALLQPESLAQQKMKPWSSTMSMQSQVGKMKHFKTYFLTSRNKQVITLGILALMLSQPPGSVIATMYKAIFSMNQQQMAQQMVLQMVLQMGLTGLACFCTFFLQAPLRNYFGTKKLFILITLDMAVIYLVIGWAPSFTAFCVLQSFTCPFILMLPLTTSIFFVLAPPDARTHAQGILTAIIAAIQVVTPAVFGVILDRCIRTLPQAPFLIPSIVGFAVVALFLGTPANAFEEAREDDGARCRVSMLN